MEIPATIEFLSSVRSSFQLLAIKKKIKTTTEKARRMKLSFAQNDFTATLKQTYKGILIRK